MMIAFEHLGLQQINTLIEYNDLLSKRIMAKTSIYNIFIILISFFLGAVPLAVIIENNNFNMNIIICINAVIFLYIMFELLILTFRFSRNTVILQDKLIIFPISRQEKYLYLLIIMLRDNKNFIFYIPFFLTSASLAQISIITAFKTAILFAGFFLFLQTWFLNIYLMFVKVINKNKQNTPAIFPLLLMIYILLTSNNQFSAIMYLPIIGWPGYALAQELVGDGTALALTTSFYFFCTFLGIFIGWRLIKAR